LLGILNVLEACRFLSRKIRVYNACSGEVFGNTCGNAADENTPHSPSSPYAVAKSSAFMLVKNYREAYGLHASSGILFNHESPLRAERFVTQKVISGVRAIRAGLENQLVLGRIDVERDWGWADEYVNAMWLMMQQPEPDDYVIATGKSYALRYFIELAFSSVGLDSKDRIISSDQLFRPKDIESSMANPSKARQKLGWESKMQLPEIVYRMMHDKV
jgi:GDPmannose 4,6-dehydratase